MNTDYNQEEEEISLKELITILWDGKKLIAGITIICLLVAMVISFFVIPEKYESSSLLQVMFKTDGTQQTYNSVLKKANSNTILLATIDELKLENKDGSPYTIKQLKNNLSVTNPEKTNLLEFIIEANDPDMAVLIVNSITNNFIAETDRNNLRLVAEEAKNEIVKRNISIQSDIEVLAQFGQSIDGATTAVGKVEVISDTASGPIISYSIPSGMSANDIVRSVASGAIGQMQIGVSLKIALRDQLQTNLNNLNEAFWPYEKTHAEYNDMMSLFDTNAEIMKVQIVSEATPSDEPIGPNKLLNVAIAGVLGLMLSAFFIFFRHYWKNTEIGVK
ncbi:MAG: hypothetical protein JJE17_13155 [Peptostreptococcaceae bacterium]|nr:hypothetical protein [Peptostreptococcaceae bacterium]